MSNRKGRARVYKVGIYKTPYGDVKATEMFQVDGLWFFRCVCHCGQLFSARVTHIGGGRTTSCGCVRRGNARRNLWKGYGEISGDYWWTVQKHARMRNFAFQISIEAAWRLFVKQKSRCALSGVLLTFKPNQTASLDRINSKLGYCRGNLQWVHKQVNKMKNNLPQEEFIQPS